MWRTTLLRAIRAGIVNFFRNGWLSLATTSVIALTLFIISIILTLIFVSNKVLEDVQDKISVNVYFNPSTPEEKIFEVKEQLQAKPEIKEVKYISRSIALNSLKEKYQQNEIIIDSLKELNENPLEASLGIKVYDPDKYESIENELIAGEFKEYVSKMDYSDHRQAIEKLDKIINSIRKIGIIVTFVLVVVSVLVTFNSIRLTMYTYRTEVEIMKLVGASNWFIRLPFITEGVLYGIFAAIFVVLAWLPFANYLTPFFDNLGIQINAASMFNDNIIWAIGIQLTIGILLGALSSLIAIRRYLKA